MAAGFGVRMIRRAILEHRGRRGHGAGGGLTCETWWRQTLVAVVVPTAIEVYEGGFGAEIGNTEDAEVTERRKTHCESGWRKMVVAVVPIALQVGPVLAR